MIAHRQGDTDNAYTVVAGYVRVEDAAERKAGLHRVQEEHISRRAYAERWSLETVFRDVDGGDAGLARLSDRVRQFDAVLVHGADRVDGTGLKLACADHDVQLIDTGEEG